MANVLPKIWYMMEGPPSRAVLLTLRNLNLKAELNPIRTYLGEQMEPSFVQKNPLHTVPFLDDNGFYITDSHAITQYLVETRAPTSSLIGHSTKERAVLNDRLYFDHFLFQKLKAVVTQVFRGNISEVPTDALNDLYAALEIFNHFLKDGKWFAFNHVTIADLHALATISNVKCCNIDLSKFENVTSWFERCKNIPGFEENLEGAKLFGERFQKNLSESSPFKQK